MGENGNHNPTQQATPTTKIRMVIYLDQMTGGVKVEGPINNGVLAYGMLELARQAIYQHIMSLAGDKRILPANTLPFIKH